MFLEVKNITKKYNNSQLVADNVNLILEEGELGALLGPSGCGKTSLLRMIAGFESVDSGQIVLNGKTISSPHLTLAAEKRDIGLVFQDYALFPHMNVYDNIAFGIRQKKRGERKQIIGDLLEMTAMSDIKNKYPHEISGGQQQRVALARAIAPKPKLLLLDEPFSNLDIALRESLSLEVRDILKKYGTTALLVTHNQQEAFSMADRTGVMMQGRILQWDKAERLYHNPENPKVADFIGEGFFIQAEVQQENCLKTEAGIIEGVPIKNECLCSNMDLFIRPEDVCFNEKSPCRAQLVASCFRGPGMFHTLKLPSGTIIHATSQTNNGFIKGNTYGIQIKNDNIIAF